MKILQQQTSLFIEEILTSLPEDSLASHIHSLEVEKGKKTVAISGLICLEQYEKFTQPGLLARTFAALLVGTTEWYSKKCKLRWRLKATKSHRLKFHLSVSGLTTSEKGYGLLPTPSAWDGKMYKITMEAALTRLNTQKGIGRKERGGMKKQMSWIHHAILFYGFKKCTGNPRFSMWMMGYPSNWTELPFPKWIQSSLTAVGNAIDPRVIFEIFKAIESAHDILTTH